MFSLRILIGAPLKSVAEVCCLLISTAFSHMCKGINFSELLIKIKSRKTVLAAYFFSLLLFGSEISSI